MRGNSQCRRVGWVERSRKPIALGFVFASAQPCPTEGSLTVFSQVQTGRVADHLPVGEDWNLSAGSGLVVAAGRGRRGPSRRFWCRCKPVTRPLLTVGR